MPLDEALINREADFLRLSRSTIDDSIMQNLNSLVTPAASPFNPHTVSTRSTAPPGRRQQIDRRSCGQFKDRVLFPSWQMRSDVLNYCASVATSPDPDDPDSVLREVENLRQRERIVDERLDPYSGRYFPREARTESLAALVRNERMVEEIIRVRTWNLIAERCNSTVGAFQDALDEWRTNRTRPKDES